MHYTLYTKKKKSQYLKSTDLSWVITFAKGFQCCNDLWKQADEYKHSDVSQLKDHCYL